MTLVTLAQETICGGDYPELEKVKKNVKLFYFEFEIFWGVESELEKVSQKILNDLIIKRCSCGRFAFYWGQKFGNTKYRADCPHIGFCTLPSNYHWVYWSPHGSTWYKWYKKTKFQIDPESEENFHNFTNVVREDQRHNWKLSGTMLCLILARTKDFSK